MSRAQSLTPGGLSRQPRPGDRIAWRDAAGNLYSHCTVLRVEGNLCWAEFDGTRITEPFMWTFHDGTLNKLAEIIEEQRDD